LVKKLTTAFGALTVLEADTVGPSVGKKLQSDSLMIMLFALSAILIYVTFRFEFWYGLAAVAALVHDAIITLGFVAWLQLDVNMALLAAILTIVGYSINDTIIVFDRVREDVVKTDNKGKEIGALVNGAINSTLARCINTVLTVLITTGALYVFGGSTLKQFALILLIGFGFGSYSSLCVAPALFVFFKKNQD
jgi:preprotein translocase subunit SecF